jgi:hypothetical protein
MRIERVLSALALAALVPLFAPACTGSDTVAPGGGDNGDGGVDGRANTAVDSAPAEATTQTGECTVDSDCAAELPQTTPANCAEAKCDTLTKKCHFVAKDQDGDGHRAKNCSAAMGTIETGDDCDDTDPNTYPGAWDGPASDVDSGPNVEPDRCDGKDEDCNGTPDDGKIPVEGGFKTCKCDPSAPTPCYEYPNGVPIDPSTLDKNGNPMGACKKGSRTCPNGIPGTCVGAVGPGIEQCDDLDHNCNGISGNQGDTVATAPIWYKDADNDNFGDMNTPPRQVCKAPDATWKQSIPNTDCNDNDPTINPGHPEICDGKDNNCNGLIDEGVTTHYCQDVDGDSYCTTTCIDQCPPPPAGYIPSGQCLAGVDCNDGNASIHPGATEICNGIDDNCNGQIDEGVTTTFCVDADKDSYCTSTCVSACSAPNSSYRTQSSCVGVPGNDCNDANANINPGATELCNGIDDNCNGSVDEGYNINQACVAGSAGVCKRNGTIQCASTSTTTCSPEAGTASGEHSSASTDPLIYTGSNTVNYTAAWDWNCDGTIELRPSGLINYNFATGSVASSLCAGDYQSACSGAAGAQVNCLPVVYPCGENCGGLYCTKDQACGQSFTVAECSWGYNSCNPSGPCTCDSYAGYTGQSPLYCQGGSARSDAGGPLHHRWALPGSP